MFTIKHICFGLAFAAASLQACGSTSADTLRIGGTGATNELVRSLAPLFARATGDTIELIPSLGTGGGNNAVADGALDICMSGRPLNAGESAKGLKAAVELRTPFGLATSHPTSNGLKSSEVAALYSSDKPVWSDGSPVRIILRPSNESDTAVLGNMFSGMSEAIEIVRKRADLTVAATDQDNADAAEKVAGSLVGATFTQVKSEKRNLRFVAIDGVNLSMENFEKGAYPFGKKLYVVHGTAPNPATQRFLAFIRQANGAAAMRDAGVLVASE